MNFDNWQTVAKCATCDNKLYRRDDEAPELLHGEYLKDTLEVNGWPSADRCDCCEKGKPLIVQQNPRKEWVRIKDGCRMPEDGEMINVFQSNKERCYCEVRIINDDYHLRVDGSNHYFRLSSCSHWRYPHPDPED